LGDVVANRRHDEDAFVALRDAFDAMRQQLEDVTRDRRAASPSDATLD
jgi:hypothetical protein